MTRRLREYILGDSSFEVRRLAFQAEVWRDVTEALFDRLGVGPGWKVLEAGAGTGTVLFPLARRVAGKGGEAHAVERSPKYAAYLRAKARRLEASNITVFEADLLDAPLKPASYDLVFARWVFLFLPDPLAHLRRLARALKPGGLLAIEDYHRGSLAMYPPLPSWPLLVKADREWFRRNGGDIDAGARMVKLMRKAGLSLVEVKANQKTGRPGEPPWVWAETYFLGYLEQMARCRPFTPARAARFKREWLAAKKDPDSLFISPTVLDVVGRKPRRA